MNALPFPIAVEGASLATQTGVCMRRDLIACAPPPSLLPITLPPGSRARFAYVLAFDPPSPQRGEGRGGGGGGEGREGEGGAAGAITPEGSPWRAATRVEVRFREMSPENLHRGPGEGEEGKEGEGKGEEGKEGEEGEEGEGKEGEGRGGKGGSAQQRYSATFRLRKTTYDVEVECLGVSEPSRKQDAPPSLSPSLSSSLSPPLSFAWRVRVLEGSVRVLKGVGYRIAADQSAWLLVGETRGVLSFHGAADGEEEGGVGGGERECVVTIGGVAMAPQGTAVPPPTLSLFPLPSQGAGEAPLEVLYRTDGRSEPIKATTETASSQHM